MVQNGVHENGVAKAGAMQAVYPEALKTLKEVDPDVYGIIEDEKRRQWYAQIAGMTNHHCWILRNWHLTNIV